MQVLIRGKKFDLRYVTRLKEDLAGDCHTPNGKAKAIRILKGLEPKELLEVYCHEILHAAYWDLGEEAIEEAAEDLAAILWKLGYRKA